MSKSRKGRQKGRAAADSSSAQRDAKKATEGAPESPRPAAADDSSAGDSGNGRQTLELLLDEIGSAPLIRLPMCVYIADWEGQLVFCNDKARALLGLPAEGALGVSIVDFFTDAERYRQVISEADELSDKPAGERTGKTIIHLQVAEADVYVEHYLNAIPYEVSQKNGLYVGCMVDITHDHKAARRTEALQETVRELTFDIGQILHANTSTLVMVNQTLLAAGRALEPELAENEDGTPSTALAELMVTLAAQVSASLARLLEAGDPERRADALPAARWAKLAEMVPTLENFEKNIPVPEMRMSALRSVAGEILTACRQLEPGHMPREVIRETVRAASELQRLTCFIDIRSTRAAVIQMDTSLAALRDFITTEIRPDEPGQRMTVASVLRESIAHLAEFSRAIEVEVVWRNRSEDIEVFGNRRDLLRAITNLLHNALKYSWKREGHDNPWISIEVIEDNENVSIEVENWGVPVEIGEIEAGLVFGMGYRGKRSKDRGRLGTGIGLTDSLRVAEGHGGSLTISSKPARVSSPGPSDREYYRQPFLTRARMKLPLCD